jgi:CubicO group peptidase (beta-lactamase class C family)
MTGTNFRRAAGLVLLLTAFACDWLTGPDGYEQPPQTNDGWATASLEHVGMDPEPLLDLLDLVAHTDNHLLHGLLIVRHRRLVFEEYWRGTDLDPWTLDPVERDFDRNTLHYVASVSKSVTSALAGIAIGQAYIGGVEDSLFAYFPEYAGLRTDENGEITLRHLLTFSSGYDWNEFVYGFDDPRDSHNQMFATSDPIGYLLDRQVTTAPGAVFHYNSGDTNLLGEIVRRASSSATLVEYAERHLFGSLGISEYEWLRFPRATAVTFASGGVSLRPRDMAKLGALYLDGGVWNGTRILTQEWVTASTAPSMTIGGTHRSLYGYGYNWWLGRSEHRGGSVEYFRAAGWGGQDVFVYPELDLVVVFTAGGYDHTPPLRVDDLLEQYILPSIIEE